MFLAKFSQVSEDSTSFDMDKNGNMPFIGKILAGKAAASIINGTVFLREGLEVNTTYACMTEEVTNEDGETFVNVVIIDKVPLRDFLPLSKELGKGVLLREAKKADELINAEGDSASTINDLLGDE